MITIYRQGKIDCLICFGVKEHSGYFVRLSSQFCFFVFNVLITRPRKTDMMR